MLKELACGHDRGLSARCKELFLCKLRIGETHNPLSKAFHHGRLQYCVSDIPFLDNR
jgi:hypothetical protein